MTNYFSRFASVCAKAAGSAWAFVLSLLLVLIWAAFGPYYDWSDSHSLFINSITTIITFFLVFIIQHTQNRDTKAIQAKLDEIIHATQGARDELIKAEECDEQEVDRKRLDPSRALT